MTEQLISECSPIPPFELSCERLCLNPDCPLLDSNGRPYKSPPTLTNNAAKLASVRSEELQLHHWQVQAVFWLVDMGRSHLGLDCWLMTWALTRSYLLFATFRSPCARIPSTLRLIKVRRFALRSSTSAQVWTSKSWAKRRTGFDIQTSTPFFPSFWMSKPK